MGSQLAAAGFAVLLFSAAAGARDPAALSVLSVLAHHGAEEPQDVQGGALDPVAAERAPREELPSGTVCRAVPDPDLQIPPYISPYTAPDIPWDYGQQPQGQALPEQVAVFPASRNGSFVTVRFITPAPLDDGAPMPAVTYGEQPDNLDRIARPLRTASYSYGPYTSGAIHFALLGPLAPATQHHYAVHGLNQSFAFTSLPAPGSPRVHIALVGDVGQTLNSTDTMRHVAESPASLVLHAGDLSYADHYGPPCTVPGGEGNATEDGRKRRFCGKGGWRWDSWGRVSQSTFAYKLGAFVAGNHELEFERRWGELQPYKAYLARVPPLLDDATWTASVAQHIPFGYPSKSPLFYSLDAGPVHVIGLSSYSPFIMYSHQWYWLQDDLCSVDRSVTPWLVVFMHVPWYNTNIAHYVEGEPMRLEFEDFVHEAGVDLVFSGHVHAYERSFPVHRMRPSGDACAPTHITIGDGGNIEEVAGPFVEPQPSYSAYREESFGHAQLVVDGPNSATYRWYRNQDGNAVLADEFTLASRSSHCELPRPSFCKGWSD